MRIAVDAMGGDHAPHEIVKGCVRAAGLLSDIELIMVGDQEVLEDELQRCSWSGEGIRIHHAGQVIEMNEHPALALRKKKDSSIMVSTMLVKTDRLRPWFHAVIPVLKWQQRCLPGDALTVLTVRLSARLFPGITAIRLCWMWGQCGC